MKGLGASIAGLMMLAAVWASPALAQPPDRSCCRVAAGTMVQVELAEPVSTRVQRSGEPFALRLAAPLIVNGRVVLPAGTPGVGEVVQSTRPGMGGKPAKLVLAARYLRRHGGRLRLQALQLSAAGANNSNAANAVGLSGIAFPPLGFIGLAVRGGHVTFPEGTAATARLANDVYLPSLGRASRSDIIAARASAAASDDADDSGAIVIPPPPPGQAQVVFFRRKSLLGGGPQWFKVRENGQALGKMTNGAYFIQVTRPGMHSYTATEEPEFKDHLDLELDPGETYFVEGMVTKGVVLGAAALSPSDRATFDRVSIDLKPAPPVDADDLSSRR